MNAPALTDEEMRHLMNNKVNLVTYSKIKDYASIDELLGPYKRCIILFETKKNYGHWCCCFLDRYRQLHFFNSYGDYGGKYQGYPDAYLPMISKEIRIECNENHPYLSELFLNSDYELEYNDYQYQKLGDKIKTCGYWVVLRLFLEKFTDDEFRDFVLRNCDKFNRSPDELAVTLVMKFTEAQVKQM